MPGPKSYYDNPNPTVQLYLPIIQTLKSVTSVRLLIVIPILFFCLFFIYPLISILYHSLDTNSFESSNPFMVLLNDSYYLGRIWFTFWQASVSTILSIMIGMPIAYLFAKYNFFGKTILKSIITLPFILPTVVVAMGFVAILGPNGIVNSILISLFDLNESPLKISNTLTIIFLAHVFYNYAIVVRIVSAIWQNLDKSMNESAKILGASRIKTFYHITIPLLRPAIVSSALLAFTFSFTSFGVVLILGGSKFATLEVAIYELTTKLFRLELAGALSIIQIIFTFVFLLLYARLQASSSIPLSLKPSETSVKQKLGLWDKLFFICIIPYMLIVLSPIVALVWRTISSVSGYQFTQITTLFYPERESYFYLSPVTIIWNSVKLAIPAVLISIIIGTLVSYFLSRSKKRGFSLADAVFMLPLGVSAVTLGFGFLITFNTYPIDLRGSWMMLIIAHSLIAYPFVIRSVLPVLRGINPELRESAKLLGASSTNTFKLVDLPMLSPALIVGATFAFAVSIGEFGASILLVSPELTTIPVAIFQFMGLPGSTNLDKALIMSTLLMSVVTIGFIMIERFRSKSSGAF